MQNIDFVTAENRQYQSNYSCSLNEQYVPNNEIEISGGDEKQVTIRHILRKKMPEFH